MRAESFESQSDLDSNELVIQGLLNCIQRELPSWIQGIRLFAGRPYLQVAFPSSGLEVRALVTERRSCCGVYEYLGVSYLRESPTDVQDRWRQVSGYELAEMVFHELNKVFPIFKTADFLQNVEDSARVANLIQGSCFAPERLESFIQSEQAVLFGHPFHPSPKSRIGFSDLEVVQYSPEFGNSFRLHYFAVPKSSVVQNSLLEKPVEEILIEAAPEISAQVPAGYAAIPVHPWEARYLTRDSQFSSALSAGILKDLGQGGPEFFPTSSVRTLFSPSTSFFYKMSLHVRVTNCIRRNTIGELKSSLEMTRTLREIFPAFQKNHPQFRWLEEPGYLSVDLSSDVINEGFSMLIREKIPPFFEKLEKPVVAAALFGNRHLGRKYLRQFLAESRLTRVEWFDTYVKAFLPPLIDLFFNYGIMFEPHLQNIIVGLRNGVPTRMIVRDLDNARMVQGYGESSATATSIEVFSKAEAWNRFVYCWLVNHLCEVVRHLAWGDSSCEQRLWHVLREVIWEMFSRSDVPTYAHAPLMKLLRSRYLPAKGNLLTRFQRCPDRNAPYLGIPNPLALQPVCM